MNALTRDRADLTRTRERLHVLRGVHAALERWPEVSAVMFEADDVCDAFDRVRALLGLDDMQTRAVSDLQVRRVSRLERERLAREIVDLELDLAEG